MGDIAWQARCYGNGEKNLMQVGENKGNCDLASWNWGKSIPSYGPCEKRMVVASLLEAGNTI